ncbi:MAG: citrate/2-methylcitrate synthase [Ilumatobacteraceae bacterium]
MTMLQTDVPRGLKGVIVAETEVGDVRGEEGFYHYRQYSAVELAEQRPIEDVWQLLIDGELPATLASRQRFAAEVAPLREIPTSVAAVLPSIAVVAEPMGGLRAAIGLVAAADGMRPLLDLTPAQRRHDALRLCAVTPALLGALHRLRAGEQPMPVRPDLGYAAGYLWGVTGREPDAAQARAIEQYLISTIDHGFNASTFTTRVVASTGADLGACVAAGLAALSGPLHGGAPSRALALIDEIGTAERIDAVVRTKLDAGERIMGFGHPVYRTADPRAVMLRRLAGSLALDDEQRAFVDLVAATEARVLTLLDERKPGRRLYTNVELYAGVVMELCGVPREMFTPTFACSRVIGWCANALEQAADDRIIRPSARYVGPDPVTGQHWPDLR